MADENQTLLKAKDKATLTIAYTLLFTFVGSLVFFAVVTVISASGGDGKGEIYKNWMALFKDSLLLVATALTTIIGYYFGQRESNQAYKEAAEAKATLPEAAKIIAQLQTELEQRVAASEVASDTANFNNLQNRQKPKA